MIAFIVSSSGSCHSCTLLAGRLVASSNGLAPRTLVDRFDVSLCIHSLSVWFQCSCGFCQWFAGISLFVAFGLRGLKLLFFFLCYGLSKPSSKNSFFASADQFYPPSSSFSVHISHCSQLARLFFRAPTLRTQGGSAFMTVLRPDLALAFGTGKSLPLCSFTCTLVSNCFLCTCSLPFRAHSRTRLAGLCSFVPFPSNLAPARQRFK